MKRKISFIKANSVRKASSISKINVKINRHPSINNYTDIKTKCHVQEILNLFRDYQKKSKSTANKLIEAVNNKNAKESVIISLRKDLDYHKHINKNYNAYKKYATDICDYYKQNFEEIFEYKANLRDDLKDFIKLVDGYEDQIEKCKNDKKMMIKTNEDIIKYKNMEKEKMGENLVKINYDLEKQGIKLTKVTNILNDYKAQNEHYMEQLNNSELAHLQRYEMLQDKYKRVVNKYNFFIDKEMKRRKLELDYRDNNLCKEEEDKADLKLQDNLLKNAFLKEIASDIKTQIHEIEEENRKALEDQELLRFLGKVFYNKVKKRRAEMELTQENENKALTKSSKKNLSSKRNNNIHNVNIQINMGNFKDNEDFYTTKNSKSKFNFTTTGGSG